MFKLKSYLWVVALLLVSLTMPLSVLAAAKPKTKTTPEQAPVTTAYGSDSVLQKGMIVSLDPKDSSKVTALNADNPDKMFGVVVAGNDSPLTLTSDTKNPQVYVAVNGKCDVLVSTEDGVIKSGDYITISSLNGVGMKATGDQTMVLGKALSGFNGSSNVDGTATLKTTDGKKQQVSLSRVRVQLAIQHNPLQTFSLSEGTTRFLTHIGYSVSSKPVSPNRLYLGLLILIITAIVAGSILFSGVRSAIVSIGRNPLAKGVIMRSLLQVIFTSLIVFIVGIFAVYLLLKL